LKIKTLIYIVSGNVMLLFIF